MINKVVNRILNDFDKEAIQYCILRNYDNFDFENNKDLDLLIDGLQFQKFDNIILKVFNFYELGWNRREGLRVIRYDFTTISGEIFYLDINKYITVKFDFFEKKIPFLGTKIYIRDIKTIRIFDKTQVYWVPEKLYEMFFLTNHCMVKPKEKYISKLDRGLKEIESGFVLRNDNLSEALRMLFKKTELRKQPLIRQVFDFPVYIFKFYFLNGKQK